MPFTALKPKVASNEDVAELSKQFIMVNAEDDEEPEGEEFSPDGGYIPRILFLASNGEVKPDVHNEGGNPKYKYYYSNANQVADAMKSALKYFEIGDDSRGDL